MSVYRPNIIYDWFDQGNGTLLVSASYRVGNGDLYGASALVKSEVAYHPIMRLDIEDHLAHQIEQEYDRPHDGPTDLPPFESP